MTKLIVILAASGLAALAGCGDREVILPGERLDPRAVLSANGPAVVDGAPVTSTALLLPAPVPGDWPQRGGNAAHLMGHAQLGEGTRRIWSAPIGQGADKRHRITAQPVVAGGLAFTLDSRARVTATAPNGGTAWSTDLLPAGEAGNSASGGGLAYDAGQVFVTTAYGEIAALDAATGGVRWRQRVAAPLSGAPTVAGGVVYVVGRDATGWAVRASDGKVLWTLAGIAGQAGVTGASTPAVAADLVVFPFASGQLLSADTATGAELWSAQVAGSRVGRAIAYIRDLTGDPVILDDRVIAGTSSGRIAAFERDTGIQLWSADEGAAGPVLAIGGSVFAINDQAQLVRLDAATGARIYTVPLPYYTDMRVRRQDRIVAHHGPILAGGRLFVASSDGVLRVFDPQTGVLVGQGAIPGGAASAPVVAGGTLYVASRAGQLHAFR